MGTTAKSGHHFPPSMGFSGSAGKKAVKGYMRGGGVKAPTLPKSPPQPAALGTGQRFAALKSQLAAQPGVNNPGALAAAIGRKKYGAPKMAKMAAAGRK